MGVICVCLAKNHENAVDMTDELKTHLAMAIEAKSEADKTNCQLRNKVNELKAEIQRKDETISQLQSEILEIGAKGRCNVANRKKQPMELADRFQKLFDNEWRQAMRAIFREEELAGIRFLAKILKECQIYCEQLIKRPLFDLVTPYLTDIKDHHQDQSFLGRWKKENSKLFEDRDDDRLAERTFEAYVKRCCELCWDSATLDPPLLLEFDITGQIFNDIRNRFHKYAFMGKRDKTGPLNTVMDVVWPAVISMSPDCTEKCLVGDAKGYVITFNDTPVD